MKKATVITIIILLLLLAGGGLIYQYSSSNNSSTLLTVAGEGKITAPPQVAQFTITYVANGNTANDAINSEKTMRKQLIDTLSNLYGVNPADIQESYPRVVPPSATNNTVNLLYQAVNTLNVNYKKLQTLDSAIAKLYEVGGNDISVTNIVFTTQNPRDLEDQAIANAIKDGEGRALKMAATTGKTLGKLVSVTGQQTQAVGTVSTQANPLSNGNVSTPGEIELTRTVTLVYELK